MVSWPPHVFRLLLSHHSNEKDIACTTRISSIFVDSQKWGSVTPCLWWRDSRRDIFFYNIRRLFEDCTHSTSSTKSEDSTIHYSRASPVSCFSAYHSLFRLIFDPFVDNWWKLASAEGFNEILCDDSKLCVTYTVRPLVDYDHSRCGRCHPSHGQAGKSRVLLTFSLSVILCCNPEEKIVSGTSWGKFRISGNVIRVAQHHLVTPVINETIDESVSG